MWLARFGRVVPSEAAASVTARLETPRDAGSHVTLAGPADAGATVEGLRFGDGAPVLEVENAGKAVQVRVPVPSRISRISRENPGVGRLPEPL